MDPTIKSSLLWGLIGSLSFLVLIQAYHLLGESFVGVDVMASVAGAVGVVSAALAHLLRPRFRHLSRQRRK